MDLGISILRLLCRLMCMPEDSCDILIINVCCGIDFILYSHFMLFTFYLTLYLEKDNFKVMLLTIELVNLFISILLFIKTLLPTLHYARNDRCHQRC